MKEKVCPLIAIVDGINKQAYCLKERCAWWCAKDKACSMAAIATAESMLVSYFQRITREQV